jgi:hypothetical protein
MTYPTALAFRICMRNQFVHLVEWIPVIGARVSSRSELVGGKHNAGTLVSISAGSKGLHGDNFVLQSMINICVVSIS